LSSSVNSTGFLSCIIRGASQGRTTHENKSHRRTGLKCRPHPLCNFSSKRAGAGGTSVGKVWSLRSPKP